MKIALVRKLVHLLLHEECKKTGPFSIYFLNKDGRSSWNENQLNAISEAIKVLEKDTSYASIVQKKINRIIFADHDDRSLYKCWRWLQLIVISCKEGLTDNRTYLVSTLIQQATQMSQFFLLPNKICQKRGMVAQLDYLSSVSDENDGKIFYSIIKKQFDSLFQ